MNAAERRRHAHHHRHHHRWRFARRFGWFFDEVFLPPFALPPPDGCYPASPCAAHPNPRPAENRPRRVEIGDVGSITGTSCTCAWCVYRVEDCYPKLLSSFLSSPPPLSVPLLPRTLHFPPLSSSVSFPFLVSRHRTNNTNLLFLPP